MKYFYYYFMFFGMILMNGYAQKQNFPEKNKIKFHRINFHFGISTQFLLGNETYSLEPHKTYKSIWDAYEIFNTQFLYYNFDFNIYKNLYFSFSHGITYDHYSFRVYEYTPNTNTDLYNIFDISKDEKSIIFQYGFGLSYLFYINTQAYKITYSTNRRIPPQYKYFTLLSPYLVKNFFYGVSVDEIKLERYFNRVILGCSYQFSNGSDNTTNNKKLNIISFYLGYKIKSW